MTRRCAARSCARCAPTTSIPLTARCGFGRRRPRPAANASFPTPPRPGPLFLSESRRNRAEPLTLWTWSKVVRRVALAAGVPRFSTHTTRHLCLTDLARMGWELHAIATFAGHRSTESTLRYIHLSGRGLAAKLNRSMTDLHAERVRMLTASTETG